MKIKIWNRTPVVQPVVWPLYCLNYPLHFTRASFEDHFTTAKHVSRRLRTTSPGWPGGSGAVLRSKSCVRKIFLTPYLMASYFCSSNYNRFVLLQNESPFFWKCLKTPLAASCACTLHHITLLPCASCTNDVQMPSR